MKCKNLMPEKVSLHTQEWPKGKKMPHPGGLIFNATGDFFKVLNIVGRKVTFIKIPSSMNPTRGILAGINTKEGLAARLSAYTKKPVSFYKKLTLSELENIWDDIIAKDRRGLIDAVKNAQRRVKNPFLSDLGVSATTGLGLGAGWTAGSLALNTIIKKLKKKNNPNELKFKTWGERGWHFGDRVKITDSHGIFKNKIGTAIGVEGEYIRIQLDKPVNIPGVGMVTNDLWMPHLLKKIRGGSVSIANPYVSKNPVHLPKLPIFRTKK
jgi:hypothetical protein